MNEFNSTQYKFKKTYLEERERATKKVFTKPLDTTRKPKAIDYTLNLNSYKYKERVPNLINDKYYFLEEEYKKKGISFSPFLLFSPEQLLKKCEDSTKEENFDYYKRHILLENYDEEPESKEEIEEKIKYLQNISENKIIYGFTKWFDNNGKHFWKKCILNNYDKETKLFNVTIYSETSNNEINKKVTRFNFIFEKDNPEEISRRVSQADKWRERAKKYLALTHFIKSFEIGIVPELISQNFIDKILTLVFLYRAPNKPQMTPLELEALDNSRRFGIWRRNVRKRIVEIDRKKLEKILSQKNFNFEVFQEIKEFYLQSYKKMEFYKRLPLNYDLFVLLKDILPQKKFLMASEQFLHPSFAKGTLDLERNKPYLEIFREMELKLHPSEKDLFFLLMDFNKKFIEDFKDELFFYTKWKFKPIKLKDFLTKNQENIENLYKEIKFIVCHSNFEIIHFLEDRKAQAKKFNKDASIPEKVIKKFRFFQNLLNRKMGHFIRNKFNNSLDYLIDTFKVMNQEVVNFIGKEKIFSEFTLYDFEKIKDDYNLEMRFERDSNILQHSFNLNYESGAFSIDPSLDFWWNSISSMIKNNIYDKINTINAINVYELNTKDEQYDYFNNVVPKITVFFDDDKSYDEKISKLKLEMQSFFSLSDKFLNILNEDVKKELNKLLNFQSKIKNNNFDNETFNIDNFRILIEINKKYLDFFSNYFNCKELFMGGFKLNVTTVKEYWINKLNEIKDLIFKIIMDNNIFLSKKVEFDMETITKKLDEEPQSVDEYENLTNYCENLNEYIKTIWVKLTSQQQNAELLEEYFFMLSKEDFFRMWSCYGVPRILQLKKADTLARLKFDRKKFKKELKTRMIDVLIEISNIKNDFESNSVLNNITNYEKNFEIFSSLEYRINKIIKVCSILNQHQNIIGVKIEDLSDIKEIQHNFMNYYCLWDAVNDFLSEKIKWMTEPMKKTERKKLKDLYDKCTSTIDRLEKTVFKKDKPAPYAVIQQLKEKIKEFQPYLPILYDLINPDLKPSHIGDLARDLNIIIPEDLNITLQELIDNNILEYIERINERSTYATGQKKLAANLEKFKEKFKTLKFEVMYYKNSNLLILKDCEPILEEVDGLLTKIVGISTSKFAKYLNREIQNLWGNLSRAQEIIDVWLKVQKLIQQQSQIFIFGDLKKQLADEYPKYESVDKQWRQIMEQVKLSGSVIEITTIPKLKETMQKWQSLLEEVNKSLNIYLNTKRDVFPRFYFVSNEELTMMLAQSGDPVIIGANYIQQIFDGIKKLNFEIPENLKILENNEIKPTEEEINNENIKNNPDPLDKSVNLQHENSSLSIPQQVILKHFTGMISEQGELVVMKNLINPYDETIGKDGKKIYKASMLEKWLMAIEKEMQDTIRIILLESYKDLIKIDDSENSITREEWAGKWFEQAVLTMSQLNWTHKTSEAILELSNNKNPESLKNLYQKENQNLLNLIKKIRTGNLSKILKKTFVSLIIQDVHANDVLKYMIDNDVKNLSAFEWISQLRYYFSKGKENDGFLTVKMLNTERNYDYEYLGNQKRLVITPLTDRCYRTMMEALNNNLGGAPEGPAGTGKTETIKDLSKNLGKKCFTYNCSEESDYNLMTKFFKGIAMSGCWICFDEFNRISVDVLSVIAYQISILLTALKLKSSHLIFEEIKIPFNLSMGIFITMNPDYAGRSELPDNLKGSFRPLAMMIPNYDMITEIMLYSFGFNNARSLAGKIVSSLRLASEQLSSQTHYDYGMRTLNGIITYIGILSQDRIQRNEKNLNFEELKFLEQKDEEYIVQKAIRDSNMPKFIADDFKIYQGILSDLFPNEEFVNKKDEILTESIIEQIKRNKLCNSEYLITKILDFNNIMSVRHAVMIVGESMASKSTILKIYLDSAVGYFKKLKINRGIKYNVINPKSITSSQLFGYVNKSQEFIEGVCSKSLRDYFADLSNDLKLLIFDGPVDTMWIENMNSVLDDTKKLCLENSDQIRLDEKSFIIFEVDDLSQASLATISRCGMVYTDRNLINPSDYFFSWMLTFPESFSVNNSNYLELLGNLFEFYYEPLINKFLFDEYNYINLKTILPVNKNWLMKNFIQILEGLIFHQQKKADLHQIENLHLKEEKEKEIYNENKIDLSGNNISNLSEIKIISKRHITKLERSELFNKFLAGLIYSICWILENIKDQKVIFNKIIELGNLNINNHNFILKDELLIFSKNYTDKDFLNYIYFPKDNNFQYIPDILNNKKNELNVKFKNSETLVIDTNETFKANYFIDMFIKNEIPLMLYGQTGTGKSLILKDFLIQNKENLNNQNWINYSIILNSKTTANNLCDIIEDKISFKLKKNTVAPQNNKNCILLIEDLNMPNKEKYGAQPSIEILRQYFDHGGWYDRKDKEFLYLKNLLIFSCLTIGRPFVSPRLLWHFIPIQMKEMDENILKEIYSIYFSSKFSEYSNSLRKLQDSHVNIIIHSYIEVLNHFKPLPVTPHYSFNLRDLNKVFEGLTMIQPDVMLVNGDQANLFFNLLIYEMQRVFQDRLINTSDRVKFKDCIIKNIYFQLKKDYKNNYNDLILFSDINDDLVYTQVLDIEVIREDLYKLLEDFNFGKKIKDKLDLILFDYSLKHLLRISRIINKQSEHGLLIGLTGSGRQSLCYLASFIKSYKIFKIKGREEVEEYGRKEWIEDLKTLYFNAGLKKENTIFICRDTSLVDETFYVDLNCIISSGIVYNLFSVDEKAELLSNARSMKEIEVLNLTDDQAIFEAFISFTMKRLRVIMCINPLNQNFAKILRSFPALINNTTIDWYEAWEEPALYYLAKREFSKSDFLVSILENEKSGKFLIEEKEKNLENENENKNALESQINKLSIPSNNEVEENDSFSLVDNIANIFSSIYTKLNKSNEDYCNSTKKKVIILPKSFLDFVYYFKSSYLKFYGQIENKIKKYSFGYKKIEEASEEIEIMTELLERKRPILIEKSKFMETTIKEIESQTKEAEEFRTQCAENESIALIARKEAESKKYIAENNMKEAEILKEEINKKIMSIDPKQFMELRSFRIPPKEINKMMQAVTIIMSNFDKKPMDVVPKEWDFYKKKLNDVKLLKHLEGLAKKLETNLLQDKIIQQITPYITDEDLDPVHMEKKISSACACFCVYFKSMVTLDKLMKEKIIPSTKESEEATANFTSAQEHLDIQKKNLLEIENKLSKLTESFNEKNLEKQQLEFEISESQKKLNRAQRLTGKLSGEKSRWFQIAEDGLGNKKFVIGNIIISSFFISFMGPYINSFREDFIIKNLFPILEEKNILYNPVTTVSKIIGNPFNIQDWVINGLPSDSGSIDNAVILFETNKQTLIIDPQKQALKFLEKLYKNNFVLYKKSEDSNENFKFIENCIKTGKVLIFDYISFDIPSEAEPLLNMDIVVINNEKHLNLNDNIEVFLHPTFKVFFISYLTNPFFNPELYGRISIINFSVTKSGLTEQLLSVIINQEAPSEEVERMNIMQKQFQLKETIDKMENEILEKLNVSNETLLDNDSLILSLEESKRLSDEAQIQIISAKNTEERIEKFRMSYFPVAKLATMIFFTFSELYYVEEIYQFSIGWFIKDNLIKAIKDIGTQEKGNLDKRVEVLKKTLLETSYYTICRSLLNKDKILLSFLLLLRYLNEQELILEEELQFIFSDMIKENIPDEIMKEKISAKPEFIDKIKWEKIIKLNTLKSFNGLYEDILDNLELWKEYTINTEACDELPTVILNEIFCVKKLLIIKIFHSDKLIFYIKKYISETLSEKLSEIPLYSLNEIVELSTNSLPIMLLMTSGLDPTNDVKKISEEHGKELYMISLGQGQGERALKNIKFCQDKGHWVFLQNLHLVPDFMKNLENIINNMNIKEKEIDPQFRLWISALPSNNILSSILVNSLKMTLESPMGIKTNISKLLNSQKKIWDFEIDSMKQINKDYEYAKFLISLMHFHSILLVRKNYGPLGWNIKYTFNDSDFNISKTILKYNLEKNLNNIPYKAIIYLTADCIYGGRVTDDWDRRTLFSILLDFYNENVLKEANYKINNLQDYVIPYLENFDEYMKKINDYPINETPELIGLHKNALIRKQVEESNLLLLSLAGLEKGNSSESSSKFSILNNIDSFANKKLPKNINIEEVKKKFPIIYKDCMNSILIQEIMRYNKLLGLIFKSLDEAIKAYKGLIPLTDEIEDISNQIISNITPGIWIKSSYPSKKPIASWIDDLSERLNFFHSWIENGLPKKFWFSAFYFTQSFLTGIKQNFARKNKISIDQLEFNFRYIDNEELEMEYNQDIIDRIAYSTYGLFIEGAEWNNENHTIDELSGKNVNSQMPSVKIIFLIKIFLYVKKLNDINSFNEREGIEIYKCPVYKCSTRQGSLLTTGHSTNYIFTIDLPSRKNENHWVKRGVAMLNQLDD